MRILLWHGYLLRGSGSNVHSANLARTWARQGHEVLVMCQERDVSSLDYVEADADMAPGNEDFDLRPGRCRVLRPDIGGLLPVYVYDDYEGFTVKRFVDLTDGELSTYTDLNVRALVTVERRFSPDVVIVGHEVMGPYIARLAQEQTGLSYTVKLHGSALEYAVKEQERYVLFAREGLSGAHAVVGGSQYMVGAALAAVGGWEQRAHVVNPGCDVELFRPPTTPSFGSHIGFVGKLIAAKGVHHLLAALGLTRTRGLRCTIVGYGGDEEVLRRLAAALGRRDEGGIRAAALDLTGSDDWLPELTDAYLERASSIEIGFPGRLEHDALAPFLPQLDLLVVPSVVPEAFGMVAAEAAACGVLPLVPRHSGIGEAGGTLETTLGRPGLLSYEADAPVTGIAAGIDRVLALGVADRAELSETAVRVAREKWSWEHVAAELLQIASSR